MDSHCFEAKQDIPPNQTKSLSSAMTFRMFLALVKGRRNLQCSHRQKLCLQADSGHCSRTGTDIKHMGRKRMEEKDSLFA